MDGSIRNGLEEFLTKTLDEKSSGLLVGEASGAEVEEGFGIGLRDGGAVGGFDVVGKNF